MKKKYIKPNIEVVEIETRPTMQFTSGWIVDGEHQGGVKDDSDLEWGEND